MHNQHGIGNHAIGITRGRAQRPIVDAQFREGFARLKMEIADRVIAGLGRGVISGGRDGASD